MKKTPALGRGMGALIPEKRATDELREIETIKIKPNPYQPRTAFHEEALAEMAASIRENGVLQPIIVTHSGDAFQIVAGERRFRAAVMAGRRSVPAIIRTVDARQMRLLALIENLQREDLDPIEEAHGYQALLDADSLTQEEIAEKVGKDRTTIANSLRLLRLPGEVQQYLRDAKLTTGHAKALLGIDSDGAIKKAARTIVERGLSVRQAERMAGQTANKRQKQPSPDPDPNTRAAQEALMRALQTKVEIRRARRGGWVMIQFYTEEDLSRVYNLLLRARKPEGK